MIIKQAGEASRKCTCVCVCVSEGQLVFSFPPSTPFFTCKQVKSQTKANTAFQLMMKRAKKRSLNNPAFLSEDTARQIVLAIQFLFVDIRKGNGQTYTGNSNIPLVLQSLQCSTGLREAHSRL